MIISGFSVARGFDRPATIPMSFDCCSSIPETRCSRDPTIARTTRSRSWSSGQLCPIYEVSAQYVGSQPDPLADSMTEIIQHMNADHKDALVLLAREFARVESQEATMTAVDRLGFHVRLKTPDGMRGARISFLREVRSSVETRKVLVEVVQQARQR